MSRAAPPAWEGAGRAQDEESLWLQPERSREKGMGGSSLPILIPDWLSKAGA